MLVKDSRSRQLLDKVYDRLDAIDVNKLTMDELKDFLEVVQKGQFLETAGTFAGYPSGFGGANPSMFNFGIGATETENEGLESENNVG